MPDFLDEKKREIAERLKEIRPLVEEYHRLEGALRALEGATIAQTPRASSAHRVGRQRPTGESPRRGRPRGGPGTRGAEALELIRQNPGISIPELAERMEIKQNYLYRVMPGVEQEGLARKEGRGWFVIDTPAPSQNGD